MNAQVALGLAEHDLKHLRLDHLRHRYVIRLVSEPPNFKLIRAHREYWHVPLPWTHYLLIKSSDPKTRIWMLYSLYMSPRHLTKIRFRRVSTPIVPNIYNYSPIFRPCQPDGTRYEDVNRVITSFWDGGFNSDLRPDDHPVVLQIARHTPAFSREYYQRWEKLSINDLLNMSWPQDVKI